MSKRLKKGKKDYQLIIDEKKGQLYLGEKDLRLLMLRPIDLIEFTEFAGTNSDDIVVWVGKTLAKYYIEKIFPEENFSEEDLSYKKLVILSVLETFEHLGYGILTSNFRKDIISISVEDPISSEEKDNIMAKNICLLYMGMFNGVLEQLEIDVEGEEVKCILLGDDACIFNFNLLTDEFSGEDIDDEEEGPPVRFFSGNL